MFRKPTVFLEGEDVPNGGEGQIDFLVVFFLEKGEKGFLRERQVDF